MPDWLKAIAEAVTRLAVLIAAWQWGRDTERRRVAEAESEVKDAQLKAALDAPNTKSDLVERLRGKGL